MERLMHFLFRHRHAPVLGALLLAAATPQQLRAAVIDCGPMVCFEYDDQQAAVADLGMPVRVGDSMQFLPPVLFAASTNGNGSQSVSVSFVFERVFSRSGGDLVEIRAFEEGDYAIIGGGSVAVNLGLVAQSNLGADQVVAAAAFNASGDSVVGQIWSASAVLTPQASFAGPASDLRLTLDNFLQASTSGFGEMAWIQKKFVLAAVSVEPATPVPIPGTLWLFSAGMGICGWVSRRRGRMLQTGAFADYDK